MNTLERVAALKVVLRKLERCPGWDRTKEGKKLLAVVRRRKLVK